MLAGEPEPDELPTPDDVSEAARDLVGRVMRTPVLRCPALDEIAGVELWLKAECLQHVGAFKARGAQHAVGRLEPRERERGVITYSSGNHGQAVALAARRHGVAATVVMPTDAPALKVDAVRRLGAAVVFAGTTSLDRKAEAERLRDRTGAIIIPPFDDPHIIAGQGTATLELCEQVAAETGGGHLDALLVPVGGGGLIAGACVAVSELPTAVLSVEPHGCDALAQSLARGERVGVEPGPTIADGLKPVWIGRRNFALARRHLAGSFRVTDEEIGRALVSLLLYGHVLVEPSGAAALAAALREGASLRERFAAGRAARIGVLLSGGNIAREQLAGLLQRYAPHPLPAG